jgi:hypothetical protein
MRAELDKPLRIALQDAGEHLDRAPEAFVALFNRGDPSVELFAPHEVDTQQPHEQDDIYIIAAGAGVFRRGADRCLLGRETSCSSRRGCRTPSRHSPMTSRPGSSYSGPKGAYEGRDS